MPPTLVPAHEIFLSQAERVEAARRALLGCLPVGRVDPAPVGVGLDLVRDEVAAVLTELAGWRRPEVEAVWHRVREACDEALAAVPAAHRVAAATTELERLLGAVGEVVEPLDAWGEAERAWLGLRVRSRPTRTKRPRGPGPAAGAADPGPDAADAAGLPRPVRDWTASNDPTCGR